MKNTFRLVVAMLLALGAGMATTAKTLAICPVCTVAVGAGVELSHWLGVDDTITGLWIGAFAVSVSWWTINWLRKKKFKTPGKIVWVPVIYFAVIYYTLQKQGFLFIPSNALWGVDKILLGSVVGALVFFWISKLYLSMKEKNHNKPHFPYEKIVMSVGALLVLSAVFYFITK